MLQVITTKDGSPTLQNTDSKITYHSVHGAAQESMHVFIKSGLEYYIAHNTKSHISILEMGLGTGLNVLLTIDAGKKINKEIEYHAVEPFPLNADIISQLDYQLPFLEEVHIAPFKKPYFISERFTLTKHNCALQDFASTQLFDIIYYDAFAPTAQPELWTIAIFEKLFSYLTKGGILVTYCAKGIVQRNMKEAGFFVEKLVGPPGKREMIRAIKKS
jgi:tRNA U34 5-methylaminomethyl-2-thiouridine-forming methyltransferase MnmC